MLSASMKQRGKSVSVKPKTANLNVPATYSAQERRFAESVKENLDVLTGQRGEAIDRAITWRDLLDSGLIKFRDGYYPGDDPGFEPIPPVLDVDIPPAPGNLVASGAFRMILLSWTMVRYKGHSNFEIWRNVADDLPTAAFFSNVQGYTNLYADDVGDSSGAGKTYYYWVRAVNLNGVAGPFNDIDGTAGTTQTDVGVLIDILEGQILASTLNTSLQATINKIDPTEAVVTNMKDMYTVKIQASHPLVNVAVPTTGTLNSTTGSSTVTCNHSGAANALVVGDVVNIAGATGFGGAITAAILNGKHIITVRTANSFAFTAESGSGAVLANGDDTTTSSATLTFFAPYIAGFGLQNGTDVDGNPTSAFIVSAETFAVVTPQNASRITGNDVTKMPFAITPGFTDDVANAGNNFTPTGIVVPAGVYIRRGFIETASIVNLIAGNVTADFIKAGVVQSGTTIMTPSINMGNIVTPDLDNPKFWQYTGTSQRNTDFSVSTGGEMHANYGRLRGMEIRSADDTVLLRSGGGAFGTGGSLINNGDFPGEKSTSTATVTYGNGWTPANGTVSFQTGQATMASGSWIDSEMFPLTPGETLYAELTGPNLVQGSFTFTVLAYDAAKSYLGWASGSHITGAQWDTASNIAAGALTVNSNQFIAYGKIRVTAIGGGGAQILHNVFLGKSPRRIGPTYASTYIRDLSVDTLQIAGNAVTIPDGDSDSSISVNVGNSYIDVSQYTTFATWSSNSLPGSLILSGQVAMGGADTSGNGSKAATAYVKLIIEWRNSAGGYTQDVSLSNSTDAYQSLAQGYGGQVVTNTLVAVPTNSYGVRIKMQARNQAFPSSGSNSRVASRYGFFAVAAKR